MSAPFANGLGNVRLVDREHINPILQGILYSTDRKAQVAVLQNESRRSSAASTPATSRKNSIMSHFSSRKNSAVSPDVVSVHSYSSEKRRKSSLFGMAALGKSGGAAGHSHLL
ncbi:hypothetical protein PWT90_02006 [Aphanocladium album]|nr:hypothetical protein PWT90_02006 [Aphanocladium album]